jgi:hypothetical protein
VQKLQGDPPQRFGARHLYRSAAQAAAGLACILHEGGTNTMSDCMKVKYVNGQIKNWLESSLCLNEIRKNLAANLERSPLTHSYGYGPAGDRPTLIARFPLMSFPSCNMQA